MLKLFLYNILHSSFPPPNGCNHDPELLPVIVLCVWKSLAASNMRAFRQVGEKQLPNPVLCMAWSPKRDLIALANTSGEVGLKSHFHYHETCLCVWVGFYFIFFLPFCNSVAVVFVHSCCSTVWQISSVFGAYHPARRPGGRSRLLPGDLMAKVCPSFFFSFFFEWVTMTSD